MKCDNERGFFYQWELDQRVIVTEDCSIVQFANGTLTNALGSEVKEENGIRYAEVPNILLQTAANLHAYAWNEETTSVVGHSVFAVEPMPKPAEYAYTQTEVKQYDMLLSALEEHGAYYVPSVDAEGVLSWYKTIAQMPDVPEVNIRGPQGIQGIRGIPGGYYKPKVLQIAAAIAQFTFMPSDASIMGDMVTYDIALPQGPRGAQGAKGEKGDQGEKGDPGEVNIDDTVVGADAWSGKGIVDNLCPAFTLSGGAVRCQPVAGYPLQVTTALSASEAGYTGITLRQLGKNLYDKDSYRLSDGMVNHISGVRSGSSTSNFISTSEYIPVSGLQGVTVTLNHCPADKTPNTNAGIAFYDADKTFIEGSGTNGATATVPDNAAYMRFSVPDEYTAEEIQIEVGTEVTDYEPYRAGSEFAVDFGKTVSGGSYDWVTGVLTDEDGETVQLETREIPALPGTNTLYSAPGATSVTGKADPVAVIDNLTAKVAALTETVTTLLEG